MRRFELDIRRTLLRVRSRTSTPDPASDFEYEIDSDGTVVITGMIDKNLESLVIPDKIEGKPVEEIGKEAFSFCSSLTSVVIPKSVEKIGVGAFFNCSSLTSVIIPDDVEEVVFCKLHNCV